MERLFKNICSVYPNSDAVKNGFEILSNKENFFYVKDLSQSKIHNFKNDGPFLPPSKPKPLIGKNEKEMIKKITELEKRGFINIFSKRLTTDERPVGEIDFFIKGIVTAAGIEADKKGGIFNYEKQNSNSNAQGFHYKLSNIERIIYWVVIAILTLYSILT